MRIAIVGCGAMGSVYAGLFAEAGHEVVGVSRDADHVAAINANGLRLSGASGDRVIRMCAMTSPEGPPADLVVLATKSAQAAAAARQARLLIGPDTLILTIQNGLGAAETVAQVVAPERLSVGIAAAFGASIVTPGHAHHTSLGAIHLGAYRGLDRVGQDRIAGVWSEAGFAAKAVSDVIAMQWAKLICNVAYSGPCAVTGRRVGEVMDSPVLEPVSRRAAIEAFEVARALGVRLSLADPVAHVRAFGRKVYDAKPSVLLDLEAGRKSEIEFINGAIGREAEKCGMSAPVNTTLTALVQDRETRVAHAGDAPCQ